MSLDNRIDQANRRRDNFEQYGAECLDCAIGEPHVCSLIFPKEQSKQKRLLTHLYEHLEIDEMLNT